VVGGCLEATILHLRRGGGRHGSESVGVTDKVTIVILDPDDWGQSGVASQRSIPTTREKIAVNAVIEPTTVPT
jgi:hypothetical protein